MSSSIAVSFHTMTQVEVVIIDDCTQVGYKGDIPSRSSRMTIGRRSYRST